MMERDYEDNYWPEDAIYMERNSRDFVSRIDRINRNAEAICDKLKAAPNGTLNVSYESKPKVPDKAHSQGSVLSQVQRDTEILRSMSQCRQRIRRPTFSDFPNYRTSRDLF